MFEVFNPSSQANGYSSNFNSRASNGHPGSSDRSKVKIKNQKGVIHDSLKVRPADDVASKRSLTFYQQTDKLNKPEIVE
jgi:hypothetical protein